MRMPPPVTSRPNTLAAMIQCVIRTTAMCRTEWIDSSAPAPMAGAADSTGATATRGCSLEEEKSMLMRVTPKNSPLLNGARFEQAAITLDLVVHLEAFLNFPYPRDMVLLDRHD